ncbi:MAG: hypothetical protein JRI68_02735 [Deltaproteobacteria bacterium]|nr:hypothetical protein [Deltaproteobacteria bacterium]
MAIDKRTVGVALLGMGCALPAAIYLWSFMVDDALISARYAANIASGLGYRFNAGGPSTDGVTPLGWAWLLAPFGAGGTLAAFHAAKVIGLLSWLCGAAAVALAVDRMEVGRAKWAGLSLLVCSAPLGAWAVAGMETGLVLGLCALAVSARVVGRELPSGIAAGLVAALRPECAPWALVLALSPPVTALPANERGKARWRQLALVVAPVALVAAIRLVAFGRLTPLALLAKTPDPTLGGRYALACLLLTGPLALVAWCGLPPWIRGLQLATVAHFLAIAIAGGDWMPLSRLAVPALPGVVVAASYVVGRARPAIAWPRLALALAGVLFVLVKIGPVAAAVGGKRMAVMDQLREPLASSQVVAALDVGWVGAVCAADIVDLAGVTDPAVAVLAGGHTSKRVPHNLLLARNVDTLVLLLAKSQPLADPWTRSWFGRLVELDVAQMPAMAQEFEPIAQSEGALRYVVLRRKPNAD